MPDRQSAVRLSAERPLRHGTDHSRCFREPARLGLHERRAAIWPHLRGGTLRQRAGLRAKSERRLPAEPIRPLLFGDWSSDDCLSDGKRRLLLKRRP